MSLTREHILEMTAGPEMDIEVARLVFGSDLTSGEDSEDDDDDLLWWGWSFTRSTKRYTHIRQFGLMPSGKPHPNYPPETKLYGTPHAAPFSTDISPAWRVVEKMQDDGWTFWFHSSKQITATTGERGYIGHFRHGAIEPPNSSGTAPFTICHAALLALARSDA